MVVVSFAPCLHFLGCQCVCEVCYILVLSVGYTEVGYARKVLFTLICPHKVSMLCYMEVGRVLF